MHSSYALSADDFAVERDGTSEPLCRALAGRLAARRPPRRPARKPDGRRRLLQPDLRHEHALLRPPARHARAPATSSATPTRTCSASAASPATSTSSTSGRCTSSSSILQPTAEAVHRDHQRPPHHAARGARDGRPLPRRGRALDLERVPRPGALRRHSTRRAPAARATATSTLRRQQGRRELRRAGDLLDARHRRRRAGAPAPAAPQHRPRARSSRSRRTARSPARRRRAALLGVTEVLPPGHQELTRRATPTVIMPVEVPMPPIEAIGRPVRHRRRRDARDLGAAAAGPVRPTGS